MRSLMNKCLNCLKVKATDDDMEAISKLITYYTEGIGTSKNEELAAYWIDYRKALLNPAEPEARDTVRTTSRKRMDFFAGYVYSIESPYGITVGGIGQRFGWYVRFKTNMSFSDYAEDCNDAGEIIDFSGSESYEPNTARSSKTNSVAGTVGLIVKCCPWLYVSAGLGYGERALLHSFKTHTYENYNDSREIWCKNVDSSYSGVAVEMDVMIKLTNFLYISAGCNTISFNYADLNAGVGIFF